MACRREVDVCAELGALEPELERGVGLELVRPGLNQLTLWGFECGCSWSERLLPLSAGPYSTQLMAWFFVCAFRARNTSFDLCALNFHSVLCGTAIPFETRIEIIEMRKCCVRWPEMALALAISSELNISVRNK